MRQFIALYDEYKEMFDLELILALSRTTYKELKKKQERSQEWF